MGYMVGAVAPSARQDVQIQRSFVKNSTVLIRSHDAHAVIRVGPPLVMSSTVG